ncbi:phosphatidylethanolamine N-methyltransferase isoform X3 [Oncorhynchus nerka]|nr:phosphatidylethanolamine N-methyltransferase isoform X3 [Oncorhynchus nerka]XP_029485001.1 phosphatidylethanolamine N-methyltransferase isoform X3 [Oncorhynchus nerka]XP_029485002.1 phosphatidylethanolamine N-methyltransferase isoform X3 [Oncorhynchus nerka]
MSVMGDVLKHIDVYDPRFCVAVIAIIFNPFFWNVVARWEHRTRGLTRLFGGPYLACYCLGTLIILLNVYRSHSMTVAMKAQARWEVMASPEVFYTGAALMALGSVLVLTSFLALGFTGTFLGDYFGILMEEKVKGFPFNVTENPMYWGSTANYLGLAFISPLMRWLKLLIFEAFDVSWQRRRRYSQQVFQECQSGGVGADSSGSHIIPSGHHL